MLYCSSKVAENKAPVPGSTLPVSLKLTEIVCPWVTAADETVLLNGFPALSRESKVTVRDVGEPST